MKKGILFIFMFMLALTVSADNSISVDENEAYIGGKTYVTLENVREGYKVYALLESESNDTFQVEIQDLLINPYFIIPDEAKVGITYKITKYYVKDTYLGDVNLDGKIDEGDINLIKDHLKGVRLLTGDELIRADVNKDGSVSGQIEDSEDEIIITASDYLALKRAIKLKEKFDLPPFTETITNTSINNNLTIIEGGYYNITLGDSNEIIRICPTCEDYSNVELPNLTKEGYEFLGWFADPEFKIQVTSLKDNWSNIIQINKNSSSRNITLYSKWQKVSDVEVENTSANTNIALLVAAVFSIIIGVFAINISTKRRINNKI